MTIALDGQRHRPRPVRLSTYLIPRAAIRPCRATSRRGWGSPMSAGQGDGDGVAAMTQAL
jgi:hypothetical protein